MIPRLDLSRENLHQATKKRVASGGFGARRLSSESTRSAGLRGGTPQPSNLKRPGWQVGRGPKRNLRDGAPFASAFVASEKSNVSRSPLFVPFRNPSRRRRRKREASAKKPSTIRLSAGCLFLVEEFVSRQVFVRATRACVDPYSAVCVLGGATTRRRAREYSAGGEFARSFWIPLRLYISNALRINATFVIQPQVDENSSTELRNSGEISGGGAAQRGLTKIGQYESAV
eukprot:1175915-Prorocentrum_minimum.AAC.3